MTDNDQVEPSGDADSRPAKPMSSAERWAAMKQRRNEMGLTRVGNIFLHPDDHEHIRELAAYLAEKRAKKPQEPKA